MIGGEKRWRGGHLENVVVHMVKDKTRLRQGPTTQ